MSDEAVTPANRHAQRGHELTRTMRPMYARQWLLGPAPRHAIPEDGMPPSTAYHLIHDELILDGSSRFNLATFCGTWMEPEAQQADVRDVRQEHDRQGRVSADGGAGDALRPHAGRSVALRPIRRIRWAPPPSGRAKRACWAAWR